MPAFASLTHDAFTLIKVKSWQSLVCSRKASHETTTREATDHSYLFPESRDILSCVCTECMLSCLPSNQRENDMRWAFISFFSFYFRTTLLFAFLFASLVVLVCFSIVLTSPSISSSVIHILLLKNECPVMLFVSDSCVSLETFILIWYLWGGEKLLTFLGQ